MPRTASWTEPGRQPWRVHRPDPRKRAPVQPGLFISVFDLRPTQRRKVRRGRGEGQTNRTVLTHSITNTRYRYNVFTVFVRPCFSLRPLRPLRLCVEIYSR